MTNKKHFSQTKTIHSRKMPVCIGFILSLMLSAVILYQPLAIADQLALPSSDLVAPEVQHEPSTEPALMGNDYVLTVTVTDNNAVKSVLLYYRSIGGSEYRRLLMESLGDDKYRGTLKAAEVTIPGLEYYIQAEDLAGNTLLHGYSFSPLIVKVISSEGGERALIETALLQEDSTPGTGSASKSIFDNKWLWVGLGVVVAAAAASGGGGDSGPTSTTPDPDTSSVTIRVSAPTN